jgi:hypothetical protein
MKDGDDVAFVTELMRKFSSLEYARGVAKSRAEKAREILLNECDWMTEKRWKRFFLDQTDYLVYRKR